MPALPGLALAGIWVALAVHRPTTTWHLAPLLVVLAPAWTAAHRNDTRSRVWLGAGVALAVAATGVLDALTLLRGPALMGPGPTAEAVMATAVGATHTVVPLRS